MAVHAGLPRAEPEDFQRWLALFRLTAEEVCPPGAAALFCVKVETIAQSLQLGIAAAHGELPPSVGRQASPAAAEAASAPVAAADHSVQPCCLDPLA